MHRGFWCGNLKEEMGGYYSNESKTMGKRGLYSCEPGLGQFGGCCEHDDEASSCEISCCHRSAAKETAMLRRVLRR
jgi:hypothetical protein